MAGDRDEAIERGKKKADDAAKKKGRKGKKGGKDASGASVANYPRAQYSVRRAKGFGGLVGFLLLFLAEGMLQILGVVVLGVER